MWCIWILLLVNASLLVVSNILSSWLTLLHNTTGYLVCRISYWVPSSLPFGYFGLQRVPLQYVSTVTVTTNSLVRQSASTSLTTNQRSLWLLPNSSCPMVLLSCFGRPRLTQHVLISLQNKCHGFLVLCGFTLSRMMSAIPGTYSGHLASPSLLVHGVGHNRWTWIHVFSLCYFHHKKDSDRQRSHHQAHTMDGCDWSIFHLKCTLNIQPAYKQFYKSDSYRIDPYPLPASVYPVIKYDSSLYCYLLCNKNPHMKKN